MLTCANELSAASAVTGAGRGSAARTLLAGLPAIYARHTVRVDDVGWPVCAAVSSGMYVL